MMILALTGGKNLACDRASAWAALHDPDGLRRCVPGCLALERMSDAQYDLSVLVPLGPVSMAFSGTVTIEESAPACAMVLRARGTGGLAGRAAGAARLSLADTPTGCRLDYVVEATPAGPLAVAGTLLLSGLARRLVDAFGENFAAWVGYRLMLTPDAPSRATAR